MKMKTYYEQIKLLEYIANEEIDNRFKIWFGESKVVDSFGQPLVVYHGSPHDFEQFDLDRTGQNTDSGMYGKGFYFTSDRKYADMYANRGNKDRTAKSYYLKMINPLIIRDERDIPNIQPPKGTMFQLNDLDVKYSQMFRDYLIDHGYDGVISTDLDEYVVLYPEQIKSTDNRGTWNPQSKNIYESTLTVQQIKEIYDKMNSLVFGGKLPQVPIVIREMKNNVGLVSV